MNAVADTVCIVAFSARLRGSETTQGATVQPRRIRRVGRTANTVNAAVPSVATYKLNEVEKSEGER